MYKTYHYDNMPIMRNSPQSSSAAKPDKHEPAHHPEPSVPAREHTGHEIQPDNGSVLHNFFGNLNNDDIILLVVIFILLLDDCEDKLLLAALGFIFFAGILEK